MVKNIIIAIQLVVIVALSGILFSNGGFDRLNHQAKQVNETIEVVEPVAVVEPVETTDENQYKDANISFELINAESNTWGYKILIEGNVVIVQLSKPGVPGNNGFKTKEQAKRVAIFVIAKIRSGQMPPTVSAEELKELNVL